MDYSLIPISGPRGKWKRPRWQKHTSKTTQLDGLSKMTLIRPDEHWMSECSIKEISSSEVKIVDKPCQNTKILCVFAVFPSTSTTVSSHCWVVTVMFKIVFAAIISSQRAVLFCLNSLCLCFSIAMWTIHYLVKCAVLEEKTNIHI